MKFLHPFFPIYASEPEEQHLISQLENRLHQVKKKKKSISAKQKTGKAHKSLLLQFLGDRRGIGNEKVSYKDRKSTTLIIVLQHRWLIKRNICSHPGRI